MCPQGLAERVEPDEVHLCAGKHEDVGESHLGLNLGWEAQEQHRWEKERDEKLGKMGCVVEMVSLCTTKGTNPASSA